jgi:hypothetical protein
MILTALAFLYQIFGSHNSRSTEAPTPSYRLIFQPDGSYLKVSNA